MNAEEFTRKDAGVAPAEPAPKCPYCGTSPARVMTSTFRLNPMVTCLTFFCAVPNCQKILSVQVVEVAQPKVIPASQNGGLIVPGA